MMESLNLPCDDPKRPKFLCLHGWRTSGKILSMQMAAFRYHIPANYTFLTAPFEAEGEPDPGIAEFYNGYKYYEWYYKRKETVAVDIDKQEDSNESSSSPIQRSNNQNSWSQYLGLESSLDKIIEFVRANGPFDGILGFSQGRIKYSSNDFPFILSVS